MSRRILINGTLHAPYFIFVRCARQYSDLELLHLLGIGGYARDEPASALNRGVSVTEDAEWTHIADDWFYTLWHRPEVAEAVRTLAKKHDIFTCSVGDIDDSFDFAYYRDGLPARKYAVEDRVGNGPIVTEDQGGPLPNEREALSETDPLRTVLAIARGLGIDTQHSVESLRRYSQTQRE